MADRIYRWKTPLYLTNGKIIGSKNEGGSAFLAEDDQSDLATQIKDHCAKEQEEKPKKEKNTNK